MVCWRFKDSTGFQGAQPPSYTHIWQVVADLRQESIAECTTEETVATVRFECSVVLFNSVKYIFLGKVIQVWVDLR